MTLILALALAKPMASRYLCFSFYVPPQLTDTGMISLATVIVDQAGWTLPVR